jgi:hypothetical protein
MVRIVVVNITGAFMDLGLPVMNVHYVQFNSVLDATSERVVALRNDVLVRSLRKLNMRFSQELAREFGRCPVFLKDRE